MWLQKIGKLSKIKKEDTRYQKIQTGAIFMDFGKASVILNHSLRITKFSDLAFDSNSLTF